jgi:hypothetical protein
MFSSRHDEKAQESPITTFLITPQTQLQLPGLLRLLSVLFDLFLKASPHYLLKSETCFGAKQLKALPNLSL